ncbi:MAG TPA: hypothetical protein VGK25_05145 [Ignavibacteria bacterium]
MIFSKKNLILSSQENDSEQEQDAREIFNEEILEIRKLYDEIKEGSEDSKIFKETEDCVDS